MFAQTEFCVCVCVRQHEHKNISAKSANPKVDKNTSLIFLLYFLLYFILYSFFFKQIIILKQCFTQLVVTYTQDLKTDKKNHFIFCKCKHLAKTMKYIRDYLTFSRKGNFRDQIFNHPCSTVSLIHLRLFYLLMS